MATKPLVVHQLLRLSSWQHIGVLIYFFLFIGFCNLFYVKLTLSLKAPITCPENQPDERLYECSFLIIL